MFDGVSRDVLFGFEPWMATPFGLAAELVRSRVVRGHRWLKGAGMGDKGGKKDKEKNKQQQIKKQKQEEQKKQDKARPRTP